MVKINRIYTRTGDDGTTGLIGGSRIEKDAARMHAVGDVDEANCAIGTARTLAVEHKALLIAERLESVQQELFDVGAELATPPGLEWEGLTLMTDEVAAQLESWIDEFLQGLPELRSFVLPGGTALLAALHSARAVTRRAERSVLSLAREEHVALPLRIYLNRLSDLLFAMCRHEAARSGCNEFLWVPRAGRKQRDSKP